MQSNSITDSIQFLPGVGPKRAESFQKIGITTIEQLLFYFPSKYLDRRTIIQSGQLLKLIINGYDGEVTVVAKVIDKESINYNRKQILKIKFEDETGTFDCVWFKGIKYFKNTFDINQYFAISGKPSLTRYGNIQFVHPDFDKFSQDESIDYLNTGKIIPYYSIPKQLKDKNIGDIGLRKIIRSAVSQYANLLHDTLPLNIINKNNLQPLNTAIKNIHFPDTFEALSQAQSRFKYEELFYIEILVALRKHSITKNLKGIPFKVNSNILKTFISSLPFELTDDQLKVLSEIKKDMTSPHPMNRLLQGDVGSGKTIVALISILISISNGYQSVLMAPTEILAQQHFITINKFLNNFNYSVELLIGGTRKKEKDRIKQGITEGKVNIIIGTHALIEEDVDFSKLGLVIIDEQHRFGVAHRGRLISKGISPDVLIMTATPIPRTLTMTLYGDLDLSLIKELPKNRMPIKTVLRGEKSLPGIYNFIIDKHKEGYQTYIVYPLVEESEKLDLKAAEVFYDKLSTVHLKGLKLGLLHGRMNWQEKETTMLKFKNKEFDVLISTTVIEVGIDVPDANIIIINDAERFGLSQLHQLRGRVGRSSTKAYCILVTKDDLADKVKTFNFNFDYLSKKQIEFHKSKIRLNAMVKYSSGFDLSEVDLKLRGPGDIFGKQQSGFPKLNFADLTSDQEILIGAKADAFNIIEQDPKLVNGDNNSIKHKLNIFYKENLMYATVG